MVKSSREKAQMTTGIQDPEIYDFHVRSPERLGENVMFTKGKKASGSFTFLEFSSAKNSRIPLSFGLRALRRSSSSISTSVVDAMFQPTFPSQRTGKRWCLPSRFGSSKETAHCPEPIHLHGYMILLGYMMLYAINWNCLSHLRGSYLIMLLIFCHCSGENHLEKRTAGPPRYQDHVFSSALDAMETALKMVRWGLVSAGWS